MLLGVRAVVARSFERIHRSNLVGMGVLPLQLVKGDSIESLGLTGRETYHVPVHDRVEPGSTMRVTATGEGGATRAFDVIVRLDSPAEVAILRSGGILKAVLRDMLDS
jgi:aconitate hydratase